MSQHLLFINTAYLLLEKSLLSIMSLSWVYQGNHEYHLIFMVCCSSSTIISCDFEHSRSSSVLHSHRRTSIQSQWHFHPVSYSTDHIDCGLGVLEPEEYTDHTLYNNTGFSQKWAELCGLTPQETCPHVSLESERGLCVCVCVHSLKWISVLLFLSMSCTLLQPRLFTTSVWTLSLYGAAIITL